MPEIDERAPTDVSGPKVRLHRFRSSRSLRLLHQHVVRLRDVAEQLPSLVVHGCDSLLAVDRTARERLGAWHAPLGSVVIARAQIAQHLDGRFIP